METLGPPMRTVPVDRCKDKYRRSLTLHKEKNGASMPNLLVNQLTSLQARASMQRWNESEGPGGKFTGHGAHAAMMQMSHIVSDADAVKMAGESDYRMMSQSIQRPRTLGGRKTLALGRSTGNLGQSASSQTPLSSLSPLTPALLPAKEQPGRGQGVPFMSIRQHVEAALAEDPDGLQAALPLKYHEIAARQWKVARANADAAAAVQTRRL
eukprot:TRINITY_DN20432_c0_g1_i1.p1 TRINITY_DN20432_c0_g1~~TRINITY_DN20432_c0_g1_i1.p1  ORF type:complete len:211 (+),score=51.67 TRINITY_DN20432_c0_g1_i1:143-775(+)